jgi:uncharacterized protein
VLGGFNHSRWPIMSTQSKPLPRITPDSQPFWDACKAHRLMLPYCRDCQAPHLPAGPVCPCCFSDRLEWCEASGGGTISQWTVVHHPWFAAFRDDIPDNVVHIALKEGPRRPTSIVGAANAALHVGLAVHVTFEDVSDSITLPRFRLDQ